MNGLVPLWNRDRASFLLIPQDTEEAAVCQQGSGTSPEADRAGTPRPDFPAPRTVRSTVLLFKLPSLQ